MLGAIPLLVIPFILYNLGLASPTGNEILGARVVLPADDVRRCLDDDLG